MKKPYALAFLALVACGGDAFEPGPPRPELVAPEGGDDAPGPASDDASADGPTPGQDASHDAATPRDGGTIDAPEDVSQGQDWPSGEDAADAGACVPVPPSVLMIDAGCTIDAPSRFGVVIAAQSTCAAWYTPTECQCDGTYDCGCVAGARGTVNDPCAANHWGTWTGCADDNGVPVVTCQ